MRTAGWLIALVLNCAVIAIFVPALFEVGAPAQGRIVSGGIVALFLAVVFLLVAARFSRLPSWGTQVMRYLCASIPVVWAIGSLDYGMLSGLEWLSVVFIALFAWGTWRAFKLFPLRA
jgi:hypothetical protein